MRYIATSLLAAALAGSAAAQNSSYSNSDDLPPYLPGANITTSGNGCPQNAANGKYASATGDFAEMDFTLHNFTAVYGGNNSVSLRTTACEAHIDVEDAPAGWQVSPSNYTAGGFAVLEPGTTVTVFFTTYWSDNAADTFSTSKQYTNSQNGTITSLSTFNYDGANLWSKCVADDGQLPTLNINFRVALTSSGPDASGNLPFAYFGPLYVNAGEWAPVTEDIQFSWRACNATASS